MQLNAINISLRFMKHWKNVFAYKIHILKGQRIFENVKQYFIKIALMRGKYYITCSYSTMFLYFTNKEP